MKTKVIVVAIFLLIGSQIHGQTRIICGRLINENLEPVSGARIKIDTSMIGETDAGGRFKISVPENTKILSFMWVGMERVMVHFNIDCDTIEIVMMTNVIYDYMSKKRIDKVRLRRFNKLPELHLQAYKKGLFTKKTICYSMKFEP